VQAPLVVECLRTLDSLCRSEYNADAMALPAMRLMESTLQTHMRDVRLVAFANGFIGERGPCDGAAVSDLGDTRRAANMCVHRTAAENVIKTKLVDTVGGMAAALRSADDADARVAAACVLVCNPRRSFCACAPTSARRTPCSAAAKRSRTWPSVRRAAGAQLATPC
jgi:hypothetical protein